MSYQLLLSTCPDRDVAEKLAHLLLEQQLAACINIIPGLTSIYRWQGQIESANECLMLIKTSAEHYAAVESCIRTHHPYDLPEIIAVPIAQGLPDYLHWIDSCLNST